MNLDKGALVERLVARVEDEAETMKRAALATREAATHDDAKPENDKDTRAIEAAYLAGAQAERVRELTATAAALRGMKLRTFGEDDPVALGALVRLVGEDDTELVCLVAPSGGGLRDRVGAVMVQVVTPRSPLGEALLGQRQGDSIEVELQGKRREYAVEEIA